jgi:Na+-transporting NADH:ubiquinone oxidoreductase subunit C
VAQNEGKKDPAGLSLLKRLRDMPNDSPVKTVIVTLVVCLVGSVLVAGSAVLLKPAQDANKERERQARIAEIVADLPGVSTPVRFGKTLRMEARVVDLATGRHVPSADAARFDQRRAARDPDQSVSIPPARDLAQIKRRARRAVVYRVYVKDRLSLVILPVHGRGFGSMLYGYLGVSGDAQTVVGLSFYEHGETPGLGALIDGSTWRRQWRGKKIWDEAGKPALGAADGAVVPGSPDASYMVDGLTGATWTSRGVTNLLRFWLGNDGFGIYLRNLRGRGG